MRNASRLKTFLLLISLLAGSIQFAAAQQTKNMTKIGWLGGRSPSGPGGAGESFRRALGALGYIEGKTIVIEYRYAQDKLDRLPALADELVRLNVDLLIAPYGTVPTAPIMPLVKQRGLLLLGNF